MLLGEIVSVALGALRANKLRSLLTMLGIVIGVAAVIAMVALGTGAQSAVKERIASLGTTLLTVTPGQQRGMGVVIADQNTKLTMDDAKALDERFDIIHLNDWMTGLVAAYLRTVYMGDPAFDGIVERDLLDGQHRNPTDRTEWFTTAYFHHPDELPREMRDAGLVPDSVLGIEGPGWLVRDAWDDPARRDHVLRAARAVEAEPTLLGLSAHLLVVGRRPS